MSGKKITEEMKKQLLTAPAEVVKKMPFTQLSDATFKKSGNSEPHKNSVLHTGKTKLPLTKTKDGKIKIDASNNEIADFMKTSNKVKGIINTINFDTFGDDVNTFNKNISSFYGGWKSKKEMDGILSSVKGMKNRIDAFEEYRKMYGNKDLPDLSELQAGYNDVLKDLENNADVFSNYSSAEEFEKEKVKQLNLIKKLEDAKAKTTEDYYNKRYQEEYDRIKSEHANDFSFPVGAHANSIVYDEMKAAEKEVEQIKRELDNTEGGYKDSWFKSGAFDDGYDFGDTTKTVLGTAGDLGLGVVKGVGRMAEGLVDLGTYGVGGVGKVFGADGFWEDAKKMAQYSATDEWTKGATNFLDKYSALGNKADAISEGLGQVAAIIGTGGLAGVAGLGSAGVAAVTTGVTGLSSMGTNMGEAYDAGATDGEAVLYGLGTGAIEAATELLSGGLGKGVKALGISRGIGGLDDIFAKKVSSKIVKSFANEGVQRVLGNTIEASIKAGGEGLEELLSGFGSAVMKKLTYMKKEELGKLIEDENLLEQFIVGTIVSSIAQSPSYINANRTGADFVTGLTLSQERIINTLVEQEIAEREANGSKLSSREKNKIYNEVSNDILDAQDNNARTKETAERVKLTHAEVNKKQSPLPKAIVDGNKTTEALYRDASLGNISLQLAKMGYLESDLKDVSQALVNYAKGQISINEAERILSIPQADSIAQMIEQDVNLRELIADPKAQSTASEETLGELVNKARSSKNEAELFRNEVDIFYAAGKYNISYAEAERMYKAKSLTSDEKMAAYYRGLENAQRVYTLKNGKIVEKKMNGAVKGGLLVNDDARRLSNLQKRYLMRLGEALNKTITVQSGLRNSEGKRVSGFINDTAVFIDASVKDPIMWTATHEFSHQMQKLAPKEWAKYRAYVVSVYEGKGRYESALETYENAYGNLSETDLQDEMASDFTEKLFKNEKDLLDFINHSKSLATKVKDMWFKVLEKLGLHSANARELWERCYKEATSEAKKGSKENGVTRYRYTQTDEDISLKNAEESDKMETSYGGADYDYSRTPRKVYNDRAWAHTLLSNEDLMLCKEKYYEHFKTKIHQKAKLSDGKTRVIEINNKLLFVRGTYNNPVIEAVLVFNTDNATDMELVKYTLFDDVEDGDYLNYSIRRIKNEIQIFEDYGKDEFFDFYERADYSSVSEVNGWGATLEDDRKAFGFSGSYTIRDGIYRKNEEDISENSEIKNSSGRSRIASAAEANRENLNSAAEYEKLRGAIEQLKGKSDGGIVVNEHSIALKRRDITSYVSIQKMAQDLGMKAVIVKGLFEDSEQALDGIITPQGVFIDADAENPARFVATHEFSHRMKQAVAKEWKKYQEYVIKVLKEKKISGSNKTAYEVLYDATRKAYGNKSDNYIHEEIAANHIGELFENEAELIDFIRNDRSLAQKVRIWWDNVLSMFGLNGEREKSKAMWLRAYKKAVKNVQSGKIGEFSGERFDKSELKNSIDSDIVKESREGNILGELLSTTRLRKIKMVEFPPYNKSHSEANQIATRWAHKETIYTGDQTIVSYHGGLYVIEKFDSADMKYQIAGKLSVKAYKEIVERMRQREYEIQGTRTAEEVSNRYVVSYGEGNISKGRGYGVGALTTEHTGEDTRVYDMGENKNSERNSSDDSRRSNAHNSTNRETQSGGDYGRKAVRGTRLTELVEEYGAIKPGAEPRRDVSVPKRTADNNRVSQFARTAAEATTLSDEIADRVLDGVADGKFSYTPVSNDGALGEAKASYDVMGQEWCEREVFGKIQAHNLDKKTIALAEVLLQKYSENGEVEKANELIVEVAAEGTRMGQSIQALSMLKKLSDNYEIKYVDKVIEKLKQDILKRYKGKKSTDIVLSDDVRNQIMNAKTQEEKSMARERAFEEIASQLPKSWEDRWNAWRYIAMLANTRTHIRNFVGNAFFVPMVTTKNVAAAIFEGVVDRVSSEGIERTKALIVPREYKDFAENDLSEVEDILTGGGKHNASTAIQDKQKVFNTKFFEWLRVTNEKLLNKEDLIFLKHHYKKAFAGYLAANKVDLDNIDERTLTRARNYAFRQAQMATYRDMNAFSSAVSKLNRVDNKGLRLVIEGVIPFKKTPANVLVRGLEYSPAGLVKAMWNGATKLRKGQMTVSEFIEELSAGLTGTGVVALGFMLSSMGLIVGAPEDDELKEFEELQGKQSYALVIGDHSYTIDWLAPLALPLFVGVELQRLFEKRGDLEAKDYYNAVTNLLEPMFELSMLSGLSDTISTIGTASTSEMSRSILENTVTGYFGQAVPTLFGQVARIMDDTTRKSYYDKNSALPKFAQYFAQSQMKKIPGASNMLEPYVDEWGREKVMGNVFGRILQNAFSPGYYSKIKSSGMEEELKRLFVESNGEYKVFPRKASKEINLDNGETLMLSAEEYTKMQKVQGQTAYNILSGIMNDGVYDLLEYDSYKNKLIQSIYELSAAKARKEIAGDRYSSDAWIEEALLMDEDELNDYLILRTLRNNEFKTDAQARDYAREKLDNLSEDFWISEMSDSRKTNYDEFIKDTGLSEEDYIGMCDYKESLKTINKGQSDEITPKEQMIDYLNQTDLSVEAKRKIYLSFGWSRKNMPW